MLNLILCGLPQCGKTVVGQKLAEQLGYSFIDTDLLIETNYFKMHKKELSCREIYAQEGELFFRTIEKSQLTDLLGVTQAVIALGGGSLIDPQNRIFIKKLGRVIYLESPPEILWQRMKASSAPAYLASDNLKGSFEKMVSERTPLYESVADLKIEVGLLNPNEVAHKIRGANG